MRSDLCELLDIDVPIVLAPFGPWDQVELAAAVCEAGALGSVGTVEELPQPIHATGGVHRGEGTAVRSVTELRQQWERPGSSPIARSPSTTLIHDILPAADRVARLMPTPSPPPGALTNSPMPA